MPANTRASVIIVAHNSADDLPGCLGSLLSTLGPDDEVIVYDGGSRDDGAAVAERYPVRVLRDPTNHGFGGSNNRAARASSGHYLVFLNPDTIVEAGWLDPLLGAIGDGPGLATSKLLLMDRPNAIDTCGNRVHPTGITVCRGYGEPADYFSQPEAILAVSGAAFAVDRVTFERLGGFDETFFMYLEDTDLSLRARLMGVPCRYVPASVVYHRHAPSVGSQKLFWLERNRWMMLLKIWSTGTLIGLVPALLVLEGLTWGYALLGGPAGVRAKAASWRWLLSHPWQLVSRRRQVQRTRRVPDEEILHSCDWALDLTELVRSPRLAGTIRAALTVPFALCRAFLGAVLRARAVGA